MDHELYQRAKQVFADAQELGGEVPESWLEERCGGDEELRREVRMLLESDDEATHFLEPSPPVAGPVEGRRLGAYRLLHTLGHGGMGTVYLAERADASYRKTVALKVLRGESPEIVQRFYTERQILAALDHPNIARLLDGGTTAEGAPYFVMDYVEGRAIDEYCDAEKLGIRRRLELFRTVCAAVHFAHQNLVVHRDLKPDNILVTSDGVVKLLDFGIAKLLNPDLSFRTLAHTRPSQHPMTPEFASPEQVRGDPITTASDVYALGVLLYLLLTGHRPYRVERSSLVEMGRVICEEEPESLSTAIGRREEVVSSDGTTRVLTPEEVSERRGGDPGKLRRRLSGDLENIVAMAMRKEPRRRYASADQLAADIDRHLEGLPVLASGDSLFYRTGKFLRRHRLPVAAATAFLVAALGFGVALGLQQRRLAATLDREEFVTDFLSDLFELSNPFERGDTVSARTLLDRGARKLTAEYSGQPAVEAALMTTVGAIYRELGLLDEAQPLLEKSLATRRRLPGTSDLELAESVYQLGVLVHARGRSADAEALFRESLALRRAALGELHPDVAESLSDLALVVRNQGRSEEAEAYLREALDIFRRTLGDEHLLVATGLNNLAFFVRDRGDFDAAEAHYRAALAILRRQLARDHPHVGTNLHNLAGVLHARSEDAAAEAYYLEALEIRRRRFGDQHPLVANTLLKLGELLRDRGELERALESALEAQGILEKRLGGEHPYTRTTSKLVAELRADSS